MQRPGGVPFLILLLRLRHPADDGSSIQYPAVWPKGTEDRLLDLASSPEPYSVAADRHTVSTHRFYPNLPPLPHSLDIKTYR